MVASTSAGLRAIGAFLSWSIFSARNGLVFIAREDNALMCTSFGSQNYWPVKVASLLGLAGEKN